MFCCMTMPSKKWVGYEEYIGSWHQIDQRIKTMKIAKNALKPSRMHKLPKKRNAYSSPLSSSLYFEKKR